MSLIVFTNKSVILPSKKFSEQTIQSQFGKHPYPNLYTGLASKFSCLCNSSVVNNQLSSNY